MIEITLLDEVNAHVSGLPKKHFKMIYESLKLPKAGAFMTVAYQMKMDDGMEALMSPDGFTYAYFLEDIMDMLAELGYGESDVVFNDERENVFDYDPILVDENYLDGIKFRTHQTDAVNVVIKNRKGILALATNAGKAQPLTSKILTPSGWKTMGDISFGDFVIGSDGKPKEVLGVFPQGKKDVYKVTTIKGREVLCCKEHLWSVRTKTDASKNRPFKTFPLEKIMNDLKDASGGNKWQLPMLSSPVEYSSSIKPPIHPYVMGVLLGDGGLTTQTPHITNSEESILRKVASLLPVEDQLNKLGDISYSIVSKNKAPRVTSKVNEFLRSCGLSGKYSHEKFIPDIFMLASIDERLELLRGLIDTDGYVYNGSQIEFTTTSEKMGKQLIELVRSLGGMCSMGVKETPKYTHNGEIRTGKKAYRINIRFSHDGIIPVSSEKHLKKYKPLGRVVVDTISKVEYFGVEECQCIMIDSIDHLYVTDDFILTHNTNISVALSKYFNQLGLTGLIIVPNVKLANQTLESYQQFGIDAMVIGTKIKTNKERLELFSKHKNIIITSSLLNNLIKHLDEINDPDFFNKIPLMILYDEVHIFGETMFDAFKFNLCTAPVRVGMTGTLPKDKLKCAKIFGSIGGGELSRVSVKELQEKGYASNFTIEFVVLEDEQVDEFATRDMVKVNAWNWTKEERYYGMEKRAEPIVNFISSLEPMNTLVLCRPELGQHMAKLLGTICIDKDVPNETRDELFNKFSKKGEEIVVASFDTSATGISQNYIHRVILVDSGKDETNVLQGIGRGIRLDGETNKCHIIDISANTLYAIEHRKERKKIYKREKFSFSPTEQRIKV